MKKSTQFIATAAAVAALYVVLTYLANAMGLASGVIQVRFSEALTILPAFTGAAVPGLYVGCLLANILTGAIPEDIIFGSLATLIGAMGTYALRKSGKVWALPLPPIAANTVIVPLVLHFAYKFGDAMWFLVLTVGAGEIISCGILGILLYFAVKPHRSVLFPEH